MHLSAPAAPGDDRLPGLDALLSWPWAPDIRARGASGTPGARRSSKTGMHAPPDTFSAHPVVRRRSEAGVSIVLAMLVLFVLVIVLFQVRFTASVELDHSRAFVDAARMGMLADAAFQQAQTQLLLDVDTPDDGSGGDAGGGDLLGGLGGAGGGDGGGGDGGGDASGSVDGGPGSDEQASIADTIAKTDSLLDEWQDSSALSPALGQDFTMFVEVEDEDSKINLLGLWNPDKDIAAKHREIVRRLLDKAFEGTSRDLSIVDATDLIDSLDDWVSGNRGTFDPVPVPKIKPSNADEEKTETELSGAGFLDNQKVNFPLTLGELADIEGITSERLVGFVEDDTFYPGLDRYLTVNSSLEIKPKPKTDDLFGDSPFTKGSLFDKPGLTAGANTGAGGAGAGGAGAGAGEAGGAGGAGGSDTGTDDTEESFDPTNDGLVNANTAPLTVLRALAPDEIPTSFIEKIVEYRKEIIRLQLEGALDETGGSLFDDKPGTGSGASGASGSSGSDSGGTGGSSSGAGFGDTAEDENIIDFVFSTPEEVVDKVEQKYHFTLNLDPGVKTDFTSLLTTSSKVFTIKILILDEHSGRRSSYRGTVWRMTGGEYPQMLTLVPLEPAYDPRRLKDFPKDLSETSDDRFTYAADKQRREDQGLLR